MKNTTYTVLFIVFFGMLCHWGLSWWWLVPISAIAGWIFPHGAFRAFFVGFLSGFLLWSVAAWWADRSNGGMLASKVGMLFQGMQGMQLILATGILGALLAAFGTLTGKFARDLTIAPRPRGYMERRRR